MHFCVYYLLFTFLFLHLSLTSVPNANADHTLTLNSWSAFEESAFLEFVKGRQYFEQWQFGGDEAKLHLSFLLGGINEKHTNLEQNLDKAMKEDLALRFESILGTSYLLVENWHCDNILKQIRGDYDRTACQKYRKYLNIAYEYLFRVFIKVADPELSEQMPAVAPQFKMLAEALKNGDKFFANFNDKRYKIAPMLLQKCWNITKQTEIEKKVPDDIRQQFVGNTSNTQIRKQFHELLKRMYETTVNKCKKLCTEYEQRNIYGVFLASPFRHIATTTP
uniref:Secreted protein n=1 Tax=Globodera rostochiensis TaxID=31243 RepID=A0A914I6V7_GLORO